MTRRKKHNAQKYENLIYKQCEKLITCKKDSKMNTYDTKLNTKSDNSFKSGFIAIVGPPNVGKSTLLNYMLGQKLSITSEKPQTTRNRILGVLNRPSAQLIFLDTPGIHRANKPLNVKIVDAALSTIGDADAVLIMADCSHADPNAESIMLENLKKNKRPVLLALNKVDLIEKPVILEIIKKWSIMYDFRDIVPISAKRGIQVEELLKSIEKNLPAGDPLFPDNMLTDMPERFFVAEIVREKVFRLTGQEIPYSVAVTLGSFKEGGKNGLVRIHADIQVEKNSQKGIIIGNKGTKLKSIGEQARKDIERMLGTKVFLKLFVRVQKNWTKDTKILRRFGY
jgi:GTPase